ncbi:hypothetical protein EXIGLDRAFT_833854 [Exidia glandulosa HHB12029]|uniref:Zn(2)-C6 fungal-type domain-containing protein n=1 Tax=Exidia glandulosa HHB12029 TaxID=1314781 RepID=A0A165KAN6_EXIGL|nr:hypothetical protein EXIGLDRAFT_833854 [Exidia glandulosa HHB12029]
MPEGPTGQSPQTKGPPSDPSGRRASHVSRACRSCRRRKVKCDKNRPCSACVTSRTIEECGDSDTPDKRKRCLNTTHTSSDSSTIAHLTTRLAAAEAEIVALREGLQESHNMPALLGTRGTASIDGTTFTTQSQGDAHTLLPTSPSYAPPRTHEPDAITAAQYLQTVSSSSPFPMVHHYHYNSAEASGSTQTQDAHFDMFQGSHDFLYDSTLDRIFHQHIDVLQEMPVAQGPSSNTDGTVMETQGVPMVEAPQYHLDAVDLDFDEYWDETEGG